MQTATVNSERASILVVDVDEPSRDLLAYCLSKQYVLATAATAQEAMGLLGHARNPRG